MHGDFYTGTSKVPVTKMTPVGPVNTIKALENLISRTTASSGLLPPAVRYISEDRKCVIFERPPAHQTVEFILESQEMADKTNRERYTYNLPVPWTVYAIIFDDYYLPVSTYCFFRNKPIESFNSYLGLVPMLNFYSSSKLCPPVAAHTSDLKPSLSNGLSIAFDMVWYSGWNMDLLDAMKIGASCGAPTKNFNTGSNRSSTLAWYQAWSQLSMEDILKVGWPNPDINHEDYPHDEEECSEDCSHGGRVSVYDVIQLLNNEVAINSGGIGVPARVFMVNAINSLSM